MSIINDPEFGKIIVSKNAKSRQIRVRVSPDGHLRASMPAYAPLFLVRHLIKTSREELRRLINQSNPSYSYEHGARIGKSHILHIEQTANRFTQISRRPNHIFVRLAAGKSTSDPKISRAIRNNIIAALRTEAKSYLPDRLERLGLEYGFNYQKVRLSHASSRWGSCSSTGTISLNIALMKLPDDLIDYVLVHELTHTVELNHSPRFWEIVEAIDPNFKAHRKALKQHNVAI